MNDTFLGLDVAELKSLASAQAQAMGVSESLIIFNLVCVCVGLQDPSVWSNVHVF